jgi:DNA-binding Lrp family transcriptional regulator
MPRPTKGNENKKTDPKTPKENKTVPTPTTLKREDLSKNEKLVFWAVLRWPQGNDRVLSKKIGLKMSTVTAIRNRIRRAGGFRPIRIPLMTRLGVELLVVHTWKVFPGAETADVVAGATEAASGASGVFYGFMDRFNIVMMGLYRNYSEYFASTLAIKEKLISGKLIISQAENEENTLFPLRYSKILKLFEFSEIARKEFGIDGKLGAVEAVVPELETRHERKMSNIEKKVYMGLLMNPGIVDNLVGKKIGVTRQSVTKIRKRFESDGLIEYTRLPNYDTLGQRMLAVIRYEAGQGASLEAGIREKAMEWTMRELPGFFSVASDRQGLILGVMETYEGVLDKIHDTIGKFHREKLTETMPKSSE